MLIPIDSGKAFENAIPIYKKNFQLVRKRKEFPQLHRGQLQKPRANIILNGERINVLLLRLK